MDIGVTAVANQKGGGRKDKLGTEHRCWGKLVVADAEPPDLATGLHER